MHMRQLNRFFLLTEWILKISQCSTKKMIEQCGKRTGCKNFEYNSQG